MDTLDRLKDRAHVCQWSFDDVLTWYHRLTIECEAWRSGRLTVWHNNTCLEFNVSFNNVTRAFSTIDEAVDALMKEVK